MKLQRSRRDKGLSLIGAVIIFSALMVLGYLLLKILLRACDMIPPPVYLQPGPDTNHVTSVTSQQFDSIMAASTVVMPSFTFSEDELSIMTVTEESTIVIQRSTNLVDWVDAWRVRAMNEFSIGSDTNQSPWCFYRARIQ